MGKAKKESSSNKLSKIPCKECGDFIPLKRLHLVKTDTCAPCMEDLELMGQGTKKHRVEFEIKGTEEVEEIALHIIRETS